ncbi:MAG: hypothetical protein J5X22_21290 [Candidatus Accumulibacter sp.]|uniref:hypothetical protein n=1 Tax=Accumulibacter sp. TaxID=2053492 RepID=UPI001ACB8190|nr:hypothetical protein [Accumulibacter sp.]MBN8517598.1 hypothetical protein [Accumulibacter sp.]MBO3712923.1 hypothetical protein [Accumulibacter sp.]
MSAATILKDSAAAGVTLSLSSTGTIKAAGTQAAVDLWLPAIREHKTGIVALLAEGANVEPGRRQPDTLLAGDQEAAVLAWLAAIGETDEAIVADVLTLCRQGEDARRYFLGRAVEISANDDRRCCSQCLNLLSGVCVVARPGGRVSAIRGHRPALPDMPQRCSGYSPNTRDTDQQTGREIGR